MKAVRLVLLSIVGSTLLASLALAATPAADDETVASRREQLHRTMDQGNFKDAYDGLRKIILEPGQPVGADLDRAVQCLERLNRTAEIDELLEAAVKAQQGDARRWWFLAEVARSYTQIPKQGFIVAGKFYRGPYRGGAGRYVNTTARDRVRALQLMVKALPNARKDDDHAKVAGFLLNLADMFMNTRGYQESWRLQYKTDLSVLPDYEEGWGYYGGQVQGAPVDADGRPIFYRVPKSFEQSQSDGQRWRWCLEQTVEFDRARISEVRMKLADFLHEQFGVQTMAIYGWRFGRLETDDSKDQQGGTYALDTLGEDETIARLATGVKRFKLPDEFNFIKIYREMAATRDGTFGMRAGQQLAQLFENRRQYPRAAEYWQGLLNDYPGVLEVWKRNWRSRLGQIVDNWGRFEPVAAQPAGQGATVEYRFRNGTQLDFTAQEIKVDKLLEDVQAYIKSRPNQMDWQQANIGDLGYRLVTQNQQQYLGPQVAQWQLAVKPREKHFDKRITVSTPLQKAGAYLLTAKMKDGNTSYIILWLNDTAIVRKPLEGKNYYYIADAAGGTPVAKAEVEFFGWRQTWRAPNRIEIDLKQFAETADADGQLFLDPQRQPQDYQWLITARTKQGRFAYLGFSNVWYQNQYDAEYNATKVFAITDRPVYRPEQAAKYKFWVRHARYDQEDTSDYAGQRFTIEIRNPKGEKVVSLDKTADAYGGLEGDYKLPADATLGVYGMAVRQGANYLGGGSFRVEEYKKPEFEVTVEAPQEPVMLGEKIAATIEAKYYFGAPVTKAKVKYKIFRSSQSEPWYPVSHWDWLYGSGYWWFAYDCAWYPGWHEWGCRRPSPFWWPHAQPQPELVADREVEIGADGKVKVEIDTEIAKAIHPDQDHSYSITAEVVDQSRRTIVGSGAVLVARKPFTVYAWVDRGYYRIGDTIHTQFNAHTLDNKPVRGKGQLTLLRISYVKGKLVETPVETWPLDTDQEGQAQQQLTASQAGQYRLSLKLTDSKKHVIEGGYLFTIIGEGFDSAQFRFNHLELIPQQADYAPGQQVQLQINTDRAGGTVLLFVRPTNGVYLPPRIIRMEGKSTLARIDVVKRDMPNFFVEAVTVADGRVHSEVRQITVPPEKRILDVAVEPSADTYRPGQRAKVKIKLTDAFGKPFVGTTVVAIYDKSVEYVSGGSNVPEIKEFFWKWQRHHYPYNESNLGQLFYNLMRPNTVGMGDLGVFGGTVADDMSTLDNDDNADRDGSGAMPAPGGFGGRGEGRAFARRGLAINGAMQMEKAAAADAMPATAAAPMMMDEAAKGDNRAELRKSGEQMQADKPGGGGRGALLEPTLRTKFADTALWVGSLATTSNGTAEVALDMPENLTTWRIKVWGMGHGTKVGQGQADVITRKDLIVRLQAPRFFVQNDEVVLSANVHNYLKTAKRVRVQIEEAVATGAARLQPIQPWRALRRRESPGRASRRSMCRPAARPASIAASRCSTKARP